MMKKSHQNWLREQAAVWVDKEIISQSQADKILAEYPEKQIMPWTFQSTFGALGAVLIGLGLLLVLAHNWDTLPRGVRLTSVMVLLVASQIGTLLAMKWERFERYREGMSLLQSLVVGASLFLVAETFPLGIDMAWLLGAWMVLILPIAYLAETVLPVFVYMAVLFAWLFGAHLTSYIWFVWPLLFALVPIQRRMEENESKGKGVLAWLMVIALSTAFLVCFRAYFSDFAVQIMAIFFYTLSSMGIRLDRTEEFWNKPLFSLGLIGALVCTFLLTFYNMWHHSAEVSLGAPFFLLLATFGVAMFFVWKHSRMTKGDVLLRLSSMMPSIIGVTSFLWLLGLPDGIAVSIMNIYLLVIGLFLLGRGYRKRQVSIFNIGMMLISALIIARFFDVDMSFLMRGVLYIVLGIVFLWVNYRIMRQKGGSTDRENTILRQVEVEATDTERVAGNGITDDGIADDGRDRVESGTIKVVEEVSESGKQESDDNA